MSDERQVKCPRCRGHKDDPAFVNVVKKIGQCFRCGMTFGQKLAMSLLGNHYAYSAYSIDVYKRLDPTFPNLEDAWGHPDASMYLRLRGVSETMCPLVEYDKSNQRLYFRTWSPSEEFPCGYTTRPITSNGVWYVIGGNQRKHYIFGSVSQQPRDVCLVEGVWDALRLGTNAVALLGTKMSSTHLSWFRCMDPKPRIHLFMDRDPINPELPHKLPAGQQAEVDLKRQLLFYGFTVVDHPEAEKEPGDYAYDDPVLANLREVLNPKPMEDLWA